MNEKWYLGTLIFILTFIGLNQEQTKVANQQVVLQFTDTEMTSVSTHDNALYTITKKLEAIGVTNIEILESNGSQLSIHYYSDIDAEVVKKFLSQNDELSTDVAIDKLPFDLPKDKLPENYNLVVSDLHQTNDSLNLNGKYAFELKQDAERFSYPTAVLFNNSIILEQDALVQLAYKINEANAIDSISYEIPEVRAGPYDSRIC